MLDLALLNGYRRARMREDGLLLRFGGLDVESVRAGAGTLVEAAVSVTSRASRARRSRERALPGR
jgi:hypothetical protein